MQFQSSQIVDFAFLLLGFLFSAFGCFLSVDFLTRMRNHNSTARLNWLFISSVIYGAGVWAFLVLSLKWTVGGAVALDARTVFAAILVSLFFTTAGFAISLRRGNRFLVEAGGLTVAAGTLATYYTVACSTGLTPALPHGFGLSSASYLSSAVLTTFAATVGIRTYSAYSKTVATALMMAGLLTLVFGGMVPAFGHAAPAMSVTAGPDVIVFCVLMVVSVILCTALPTYNIENQSRREAMEQVNSMSVTDNLTGLANRDALKTHIAHLCATTDPDTTKFAVLAFNLNRFRVINDVHGSEAGDRILKTVANRILAALGPGEFVARVSGDEFYAVKAFIHRKSDGVNFGTKVLEIVQQPIMWGDSTKMDISASVGGALFSEGETAESLMAQADMAMVRAKHGQMREVVFFDGDIDKTSRELNVLVIDLRRAIDEEQFEVYYQPQHSAEDRRLVGFEALVRWNHPEKGMVSPANFIPLAEKTGMINEIGTWVLRRTCLDATGWDPSLSVAVNVSANQLMKTDLPEIVREALEVSGLDPKRLELEITESGIIGDFRHAQSILMDVKAKGVSIAMDDFGTGYSSLSTFHKFPFDKIKVDMAFIRDLIHNTKSQALVNATIAVGKTLGIKVLAEGVETEDQLNFLVQGGCNEVQGYYFGKPMPKSAVDAMLAELRFEPHPVQFQDGKIIEFKKA